MITEFESNHTRDINKSTDVMWYRGMAWEFRSICLCLEIIVRMEWYVGGRAQSSMHLSKIMHLCRIDIQTATPPSDSSLALDTPTASPLGATVAISASSLSSSTSILSYLMPLFDVCIRVEHAIRVLMPAPMASPSFYPQFNNIFLPNGR